MAGDDGRGPRAGDGRGARMLIDGEWIGREETIDVANPFDGRLVDTVPRGRAGDIAAAVTAAAQAVDRPWPTHARYDDADARGGAGRSRHRGLRAHDCPRREQDDPRSAP